MKNLSGVAILLLGIVVFLMGCGNTPENAKEYQEKLVAIQGTVVSPILDLYKAMKTRDMDKINPACANAVKACAESIEAVKNYGAFGGDDTMRQKLEALLEFYKSMIDKDLKEVIAIIAKGEPFSQEDKDRVRAITKGIGDREVKYDAGFRDAVEVFAGKYGLGLMENEGQKEVDSMAK